MTGRVVAAEAFAYVDNCLEPAARRAFEARLRDDPELKRQVAQWEAQNHAIRAAFGAAGSSRGAIELGRISNENLPAWMAPMTQARRSGDAARPQADARPRPSGAEAVSEPQPAPPLLAAPRSSFGRNLLAFATLAAGLLVVGAPGGPSWPRAKLVDAALAAYRAFATPAAFAPVEFRTSDPEALTRWFAPQIARGVVAPRIESSAVTLLGGRIAPGTASSAAFLIYEDRRGERIGLLIEPLDAPAPSKPTLRDADGLSVAAWTDAGRALVAAGPDRESVIALTRLVEDSEAASSAPAQRR